MNKVLSLAALSLVLSACSSVPTTPIGQAEVCQAAVANAFGKGLEGSSAQAEAEQWLITYTKADGSIATQSKCKVEGNSVVWGSYPDGRWRDMEFDPSLSYQLEGNTVTITQDSRNGQEITEYQF